MRSIQTCARQEFGKDRSVGAPTGLCCYLHHVSQFNFSIICCLFANMRCGCLCGLPRPRVPYARLKNSCFWSVFFARRRNEIIARKNRALTSDIDLLLFFTHRWSLVRFELWIRMVDVQLLLVHLPMFEAHDCVGHPETAHLPGSLLPGRHRPHVSAKNNCWQHTLRAKREQIGARQKTQAHRPTEPFSLHR